MIFPGNLVDTCLDGNIDKTSRIIGASIEVDTILKKVCIAYGCVKRDTAASYYFEKDSSGYWHGPTMLPSSISDSTNEPLVPFIDIDSIFDRVVFSANRKVYFNKKCRNAGYQA